MSKITKYLNQTCKWQKCLDTQDMYGVPGLAPEVELKCRKRLHIADVITATGAVKQSQNRYTLDNAEIISPNDIIDGKSIMLLAEYVNVYGQIEGYKVLL